MMQFDPDKFEQGAWKTMANNVVLASPHSKRLALKQVLGVHRNQDKYLSQV